jgi:hypothetical protein
VAYARDCDHASKVVLSATHRSDRLAARIFEASQRDPLVAAAMRTLPRDVYNVLLQVQGVPAGLSADQRSRPTHELYVLWALENDVALADGAHEKARILSHDWAGSLDELFATATLLDRMPRA